jgi:hypothetical protein
MIPTSPLLLSSSSIHCWIRAFTWTRFRCGGNFGFGFPLYPPRIPPPFQQKACESIAIIGLLTNVLRFTKKSRDFGIKKWPFA